MDEKNGMWWDLMVLEEEKELKKYSMSAGEERGTTWPGRKERERIF